MTDNMSLIQLPRNGRGGSYYHDNTTIQTYQGILFNFTLADLDLYYSVQVQYAVLDAVCFGLCLMAFIQIVALTPSTKRGLPLFTFNLIAIFAEEVRLLCLTISQTKGGYVSMYFLITNDYTNSRINGSTHALEFLEQIMAPIAFFCVQCCLFIQGNAVLSAFKHTHKKWWNVIMAWLVGFGGFVCLWRITVSIWACVNELDIGVVIPLWVWTATDIFYAVSIGSWSLVFVTQVGILLYRRVKLGGNVRRTEALNILMMTGVESMILPLLFCILQLVTVSWLVEPELLIIPSVVILLPFGSLWAGSMQSYDPNNNRFSRSMPDGRPVFGNFSAPPSGSTASPLVASRPDESSTSTLPSSIFNSGTYAATVRAGGSPNIPPLPNRPMGLLEALSDDQFTDDGYEMSGGIQVRQNYSITHAPRTSSRPENSPQRFPAERV